MTPARGSDAMVVSLSELAFLLLSIAIAAAVLLAVEATRAQEAQRVAEARSRALAGEVRGLEREVDTLTAQLDDLLGGVVACYRRPGSGAPPIAAEVTILSATRFSIQPATASEPLEIALDGAGTAEETDAAGGGAGDDGDIREAMLIRALADALRSELAMARAASCYLRIGVANRTSSYEVYRLAEGAIRALGMVVVPQ